MDRTISAIYSIHKSLVKDALVSIAERFGHEINWSQIAPQIRLALAMMHHLTPLSDELIHTAGINPEDALQPDGSENFWQFAGWPRATIVGEPGANIPHLLRDSFFPPAW